MTLYSLEQLLVLFLKHVVPVNECFIDLMRLVDVGYRIHLRRVIEATSAPVNV